MSQNLVFGGLQEGQMWLGEVWWQMGRDRKGWPALTLYRSEKGVELLFLGQ